VRRRWRWGLAPLLLLALLLAARAALPHLLERYVNRVLDRGESYTGRVDDVDVALWRGAYRLDGVVIEKRGGRAPVPLFRGPRVDLSIEWRALLDGALVGEIHFDEPELNVVGGPARQTGTDEDWRSQVEALFPTKINRVEARRGRVHYRSFHTEPEVDVYLRDIELVVGNLTNSKDLASDRVARFEMRAVPMERGRLWGRGTIDPFAERPDFDLDATVTGADLTQWNDYLRAYAGVDVQQGSFSVYTELVAREGRFDGYLKPLVEDLDVLDLAEEAEEQGLLSTIWEALVGTAAEVLEHQPEDRQATRIPLTGTIDDPEGSFWAALGAAIRNAFVEGIVPRLEGSVGAR
jgi:hypothetical protein